MPRAKKTVYQLNPGNTHPSPEVKLRGRAVSIVSNFVREIEGENSIPFSRRNATDLH
jgi:hypothetical protein